jgi:hypothetical protein
MHAQMGVDPLQADARIKTQLIIAARLDRLMEHCHSTPRPAITRSCSSLA